jgi:hypothetical protein
VSYKEESNESIGLTTITLTCEALRGKQACGNVASVGMQDRQSIINLLYSLGWRLCRGHQVCGLCAGQERIRFPRK